MTTTATERPTAKRKLGAFGLSLQSSLHLLKPTNFRWRAIHVHPTLIGVKGWNRVKFWWGQDIWFGRWPVLKINGAILALLLWRSFR